jgi:polygalacturonase
VQAEVDPSPPQALCKSKELTCNPHEAIIEMEEFRREFLKMAGLGIVGGSVSLMGSPMAKSQGLASERPLFFDVRSFGATGDGKTVDSVAINAAIETAAAAGGGTIVFPAGMYVTFSIRLKSYGVLFLQQGATIMAADSPRPGEATGYMGGTYDAAEPKTEWDAYQDYGHNHWHNSLLWGENIHDLGIFGPGLMWGKGLSHGGGSEARGNYSAFRAEQPGVGNKAIALKNCHNVIFRDFSIFRGGHFGLLLTGVDNLTIDNLKIDTDRDGMDIDCCKNVRVSNCSVNSPWDDGICPKSSLALGYLRATENVTISNCFVTGDYQLGSVIDGSWKRHADQAMHNLSTGRIKCGTESNGGFKNITISNCVFEGCRGLALETVDGAQCEDITFTGITMRDPRQSPLFLRLGARLRGAKETTKVGTLKRIIISNITSSGAAPLCTNISGMPGYMIEDLKISDVFFHQAGGGDSEIAKRQPPELEKGHPEPPMFGDLPATGLFVRHVRNLDVSNLEVMIETADARPAFWLMDVDGADFFRVKVPRLSSAPAFRLQNVEDFRVSKSKYLKDAKYDRSEERSF